ncbi:MAG: ATP synthase subunit C [Candidatus Asgardarchaeia archaeon]
MRLRTWVLLSVLYMIAVFISRINPVFAAVTQEEATFFTYKFLSMAMAVSLPAFAAGYAVAKTGSSAVASITEKPELFGKAVIFVGLAEGIAIYGLLVAFLVWITGA